MMRLLRTHLALRTTAIILLIVGIAGLLFLLLALQLTESMERERQTQRLEELLDTVQSTVSIAAFLGDQELAREVARGLLGNRTVRGVMIWADDREIALEGVTEVPRGNDGQRLIWREIRSPFDASEVVGAIALLPDDAEIHEEVRRSSRFIAWLVLAQLGGVGAGVVFVVVRLITRPIVRISNRLHGLRAEAGEKLSFPRGNEEDEIGRLVNDVNALIDYLVRLLRDERELRLQREVEERKFRTIFENAETGIFQIDEAGSLLSSNRAFRRIFSVADEQAVENLDLARLTGDSPEALRAEIRRCIELARPSSRDILLSRQNSPAAWVNLTLNAIEDSRLQGVANDITERKQAEQQATELATTDVLTGLANRLGLERELDAMIQHARRDPRYGFALFMIDLDHFKQVNDTHGHQAGDEVLQWIASLLADTLRRTDVIARMGGDEFVVLLDGLTERDLLSGIADKLLESMREPLRLSSGVDVQLGMSIGIAVFARHMGDARTLTEHADRAMYAAKQAGRNQWRFSRDDD